MPDQRTPEEIFADVDQTKAAFTDAVNDAETLQDLDEVKRVFLSKKGGRISDLVKLVPGLPNELKPKLGQAINQLKSEANDLLSDRRKALEEVVMQEKLAREKPDLTLPGVRTLPGPSHPLTQTMQELRSIFQRLGYSYDEYSEVETEEFNFDVLNMPESHPARDMHDTFYLEDGRVLRTHTSAFQGHVMKLYPPPLREITLGRCYRKDTLDATHSPMFHQLDGISISKDCSFAELKWTLYHMAREMFGGDVEVRFRPSFFPFTTPSAEMDIKWKHGWTEILGSGMMHPHVLRYAGIDPEEYRGIAFGIGLDRMAMIRHGIDDIRLLYENDMAFLSQFQ